MKNYIVATVKPWNIDAYNVIAHTLPGRWHLITKKEDLTEKMIASINPRYIFFPHWSWQVPPAIFSKFECVCFHMTDVPYGRGGSPLQNLIQRGHKKTKLSALRMKNELDAGPIYYKEELDLDGSAQDIFTNASKMIYRLIEKIISNEPKPEEQVGEVTIFSRRKPEDSQIPYTTNLENLYDHIRMLDAETYPKSFIKHGDLVVEFDKAIWDGNSLIARAVFKRNKDE